MHRFDSLRWRLPLLAIGVLAVSLAIATVLARELVVGVAERDQLTSMQRERDRFEQSIQVLLAETDATLPLKDSLIEASRDYLRLNPGTEQYLRVVRVGSEASVIAGAGTTLTSRTEPPGLVELVTEGQSFPLSRPGQLETIDTPSGMVRSLVTPLVLGGETVAFHQVAAPTDAIASHASEALRQMLLVVSISLAVGGLLLATVLWRALRPLERLSTAVRATELQDLSARVPDPERRDEVGQLAREFNAMLERLQRAVSREQQLLASVSHELRTPLTIARGHVETLERSAADDPAVIETAGVVRDELQRIARLVEDLMALARADTPTFVTPRPVELETLFDDLQLRLIGLGVPNVEVHPPPPGRIEADATRIEQALLNLIHNAAIHTPPGTCIELGARQRGGRVGLFVRDNGSGIDPGIHETVFQPYVRGTASNERDSTGLGMAVVKAVVDAHAGEVALKSDSSGTEVTIWLTELRDKTWVETPVATERE